MPTLPAVVMYILDVPLVVKLRYEPVAPTIVVLPQAIELPPDKARLVAFSAPLTFNLYAPGEAVPIPTLPLAKTVSRVEVAVPAVVEGIVNSGVLAVVLTEFEIERRE